MLHMLLHHMTTLLIAGAGLGTSPMATPSPMDDPSCVSSVTVSSTITNDAIVTTVTPDKGTACSSGTCSFPVSAGSRVGVSYASSSQFMYREASNNVLKSAPTSIAAPSQTGSSASIDFAVLGADDNDVLFLADPKITVTSGGCITSI